MDNDEVIVEINRLRGVAQGLAAQLESDMRNDALWNDIWEAWKRIEALHVEYCHIDHILPENFTNPEKAFNDYSKDISMFLASSRVAENPQWRKPDAVRSFSQLLGLDE